MKPIIIYIFYLNGSLSVHLMYLVNKPKRIFFSLCHENRIFILNTNNEQYIFIDHIMYCLHVSSMKITLMKHVQPSCIRYKNYIDENYQMQISSSILAIYFLHFNRLLNRLRATDYRSISLQWDWENSSTYFGY